MRILLIGASGMIGARILAEAVARGHHVTAATRNPGKIPAGAGVSAVALDATDIYAIAALAAGADAIVSATSPRSGADAITEAAAVGKAEIEAARRTGKRLFVVGGAGSLTFPDGTPIAETVPEPYRPESLGMRGVRDLLRASDIDWTFFSPAHKIAPGERTGRYRLGGTTILLDENGESRISAEDYAHAVLEELETPRHRRAQFTIGY
jgi:hypothetical protein